MAIDPSGLFHLSALQNLITFGQSVRFASVDAGLPAFQRIRREEYSAEDYYVRRALDYDPAIIERLLKVPIQVPTATEVLTRLETQLRGLRGYQSRFNDNLNGLLVFENPLLTVTEEDWSQVRSPGRARRRRKRGFRQNIVTRTVPDPKFYTIDGRAHVHPETLARLKIKLTRNIESHVADAFAYAVGAVRP